MTSDLTLEAELLRRYDRPGTRYTSYPTAPQFSSSFGEPQLRKAVQLSNGDPIPRRLSLYLHVPFCMSPCFYCGCNRIITRDLGRGENDVMGSTSTPISPRRWPLAAPARGRPDALRTRAHHGNEAGPAVVA